MIISTLSLKGGAGKTTITINLAVYFAEKGLKVVIVDSDVNGNVRRWNDLRESRQPDAKKIDFIELNTIESFTNEFDELTKPYDLVLIDGRPAIDTMTRFILNMSNFALFPIKPSPLDMWTNDDVFIDVCIEAQKINKDLNVAFVLNGVKPNTNLSYECRLDLMEYEETTNIKTLQNQLSDRTTYASSLMYGLGAIETTNFKAKHEVKLLCEEIIKLNNLSIK